MSAAESWILEVRRRLESPPPRPAVGGAPGLVVLLPLFVAEASLCSVFTVHHPRSVGEPIRLGLVGAPVRSGEERWAVAARIAQQQLELDAERVLRLGDLDPGRGLDGSEILPCVAAIPGPPAGGEPSLPSDLFAAPLTGVRERGRRGRQELGVDYPILSLAGSASSPASLRGEMELELWGPPASIVQNLLVRLGLAS